jgi:thiosulfate/3-mercaptopyruvate sulfurtransferase
MRISSQTLLELLPTIADRLIDSRAPERHRGEIEPFDPVAGHIPGGVNFYWMDNLDANERFLEKELLQERFRDFLVRDAAERPIVYCGSGVTACHNILALTYAGAPEPILYDGAWSEWCSDPTRPVKTQGP